MARLPAKSVRYGAKLTARPAAPVTSLTPEQFLDWSLYHFVGTPGGYHRPSTPRNLTLAKNKDVFDEWARYAEWQARRAAHKPRPAVGLWPYGRVPEWAWTVARAYAKAHPATPVPVPTPTPPSPANPNAKLVARAQRVMFTAWRPLSSNGRRPAISADLNVGGNPTQHVEWAKQAVREAKDRGQEPAAWANQSQVGVQHLISFAGQIGASYIIWQAETIGEMIDVGIAADGSITPGSPQATMDIVLVGNPNAWTPAQCATATRLNGEGRFALIFEVYTNEGAPWPNASGSAGVPALSLCPGVGWGRYPYQLPAYKPNTPAPSWPTISPYLSEDFDDSSWAIMPW